MEKIGKEEIYKFVKDSLYIKRGINKQREIVRLIWEILKIYNISLKDLSKFENIKKYIEKGEYNFDYLKKNLLAIRYPHTFKKNPSLLRSLYLPEIPDINYESRYKFSGNFEFEKVYIERGEEKTAEQIIKKIKVTNKIEVVRNLKEILQKEKNKRFSIDLAKKRLFIYREKYDFHRPCPCTKGVISCGYYVLNTGFGCPFDCTYCYLQHYTNIPVTMLPVNIEEYVKRVKNFLNRARKVVRAGTGEFTDSLAYEPIFPVVHKIVSIFYNSSHFIELKTKSRFTDTLFNIKPARNIVIAWSLNPEKIAKKEELYTASLKERLKKAEECGRYGFGIAFHFDPIIIYPGWERDYFNVIEQIYNTVNTNILWFSLGLLRFNRELKNIAERRFPDTEVFNGELIPDKVDGKMRYPEFMRIEVFSKFLKWIRKFDKKVIIYLCMEPEIVWKKSGLIHDFILHNPARYGIYL